MRVADQQRDGTVHNSLHLSAAHQSHLVCFDTLSSLLQWCRVPQKSAVERSARVGGWQRVTEWQGVAGELI